MRGTAHMACSPRTLRRKDAGDVMPSTSPRRRMRDVGELAASCLKERVDAVVKENMQTILQCELERLKSSMIVELAENKDQIIRELSGTRGWRLPSKETPATRGLSKTRALSKTLALSRQASAGNLTVPVRARSCRNKISQKWNREESETTTACDTAFSRQDCLVGKANDKQPLLDAPPANGEPEQSPRRGRSPVFDRLSDFVQGSAFETIAASVVLLSVLWLTFQTQYNAIMWKADSTGWFIWVEVSFSMFFAAELILRIIVFGCKFFFTGPQSVANVFDTSIVILQFFDSTVQLVGASNKKAPIVSVFRVLRLFRIVRLVRIFRFFPDLRMLLVSAFQAFHPLMWVFALILAITGSFAIVITSLVNEYKAQFTSEEYAEKEEDYGDDITRRLLHRNLLEFFGSVDRSALSLYGAISGGRDWQSSAAPLATFVNEGAIYIFVFYTFFVVFSMMNIITSQCVGQALEASAKDRLENMVGNLMDAFSKEDTELVTEETFLSHLSDAHMRSFLKDLYKREDVTADEIKASRLFEMLDYDGSGALTREELMMGCVKLTGSATSLDLAVLKMDVLEIRSDLQRILGAVGSEKPLLGAAQQA